MADDPLASFTGRFPVSVLERVDQLAIAMSAANIGLKVSRSDAMRVAVEAGLLELEARYGLGPKTAQKGAKPPRKAKP